MKKEHLRISNAKVVVDGQEILKSINLSLYFGEIHGIISGNIHDANFLVALLSGRMNFNIGSIYYYEDLISMKGIMSSLRNRVFVISRESLLAEEISIADNIFLIQKDIAGSTIVDESKLIIQTQDLFDRFGFLCEAKKPVKDLNNFEQTVIAILKASVIKKEIILLDQRMNIMSAEEQVEVYRIITSLKDTTTFIIIDNDARNLLSRVDNLTIINHGKTIFESIIRSIDESKVNAAILGSKGLTTSADFRRKTLFNNPCICDYNVKFIGVYTNSIKDLNFQAKCNEILSISCENKRVLNEIRSILMGDLYTYRGQVLYNNSQYKPKNLINAVNMGICFIEENPAENHLFKNMSVMDNFCLLKTKQVRNLWSAPRYKKSISRYIIKMFGRDISNEKINSLSSEVLQKLAYYRWLFFRPNVIVCINPFSTVDVHMSAISKEVICKFQENGICVIILAENQSNIFMESNQIVYAGLNP